MKTLIKNGYIIPMTDEEASFYGNLCFEDSNITYIGKSLPENFTPDETIDATGCIVMPSFVNAHTHAAMTLMRNYKDRTHGLSDWLSQIFQIEDKLEPNDIRVGSVLGMAEMIKSGITCFEDMYFSVHETMKEALNLGIRMNAGLTLFGDLEETKKRYVKRLIPMEQVISSNPGAEEYLKIDIAPHALYTVTADSYKYAISSVKERGCRLHTHASETLEEIQNVKRMYRDKTPGLVLADLGAFDQIHTVIAHGDHFTKEEFKIIASVRGTSGESYIVHNPCSNAKLASGILDTKKCREMGVPLALGTDGASSNNNLSIMKEMNVATLLASAVNLDTQALPAYEVLKMATCDGARALGRINQIGTLEEGKRADLLIVDMETVNNCPVNDSYSALVYSATEENIKYVFCNGRMLLKNRKLTMVDESKLIKETKSVWKSVCER